MKRLSIILIILFTFFGLSLSNPQTSEAYTAVNCTNNSQCAGGNPCGGCAGGTAWCNSSGQCQYTCTNCGGCGGVAGCDYGAWSPCSADGWRTRRCNCDNNIYQIDYCGVTDPPPNTGGPGNTNTPTNTPVPPVPSCTITISGAYNTSAGNTVAINPVITTSLGTVDEVTFTVANTAYATVCENTTGPCAAGLGPYTDNAGTKNADLTGQAAGSTTLTAVARMLAYGVTCTSNVATVTVVAPSAWWQVVGGDLVAGNVSGTSVQSLIPATCVTPGCTPVLVKDNAGGFSGIPGVGGTTLNLSTGTTSASNWRATNSPFLSTEGYSYAYFENKIPSGITPTLTSGATISPATFESGGVEYPSGSGYFWYRYNGASGNQTISGGDGSIDLSNRKVIYFVNNANLTLGTDVQINPNGRGGFYVFANQNINIAPTVGDAPASSPTADIEAILFAGGQIFTGHAAVGDDLQLHVRGSLVGLGTVGGVVGVNDGIVLQRNLFNDASFPGEVFEYAPDLILNWPGSLTGRTLQWREVAP